MPSEQSLTESERLFQLVANTAPVMIWMSGPDKLCNYFNQPWLEFTGRALEAELGNGWSEGVHPDDLLQCMNNYLEAFEHRAPFRMTYRLRRHDGEYRWVLDQGVPRFDWKGDFAGFIGSCVDVTEQKHAEDALTWMNQRLLEVQEEERSWLARELHDDINQRVGLLALNLESLSNDLAPEQSDLRGRIAEECERVSRLATDIQGLSHRLHSSKLRLLGLMSAAQGFCKELEARENVQIEIGSEQFPDRLPEDIALCLFRILQEALQNAVRHSRSKRFLVNLVGSSKDISLTVKDWGVGFQFDETSKNRGLGLTSMHERLKIARGRLDIESSEGGGTTIRATVPLRDEPGPQTAPDGATQNPAWTSR